LLRHAAGYFFSAFLDRAFARLARLAFSDIKYLSSSSGVLSITS